MSFNGSTVQITPPQHSPHSIEVPHDRSTLPPRILEALDQALDAQEKHHKAFAKISTNRPAVEKTGDALTEAWNNLTDTAFATSEANQQHHREAYTYAARKLERAIEDAKAAVHSLGIHAHLYDTAANSPARIGIDRQTRAKAVAMLRCLQESLDALPPVPPIDA
ncbi:hypothetical protein [Streptomyces canus]|uniref:hypothetical protein n=1 Tax=Streptomyces canus TaxID=58343 RepID=UPI0003762F11|nr:hypothetical protein [Streptomyces canus]